MEPIIINRKGYFHSKIDVPLKKLDKSLEKGNIAQYYRKSNEEHEYW